jgi:hypothetical protein
VAVRVNAAGQLGTFPSSTRFKQNIKPSKPAPQVVNNPKAALALTKQQHSQLAVTLHRVAAFCFRCVNPSNYISSVQKAVS